METSESIKALAPALVEAMGELQNVVADTSNPFFKSRYASLPHILDSVRPVLAKHGLTVTQLAVESDGRVGIESLLLHKSGEWIKQTLVARPQKDDPQGYGSAITYCRRYALTALLGIGQEDDDGNAASQAPAAKAGPQFGKRAAPAAKAAAPAVSTDPWLLEKVGIGKKFKVADRPVEEATWAEIVAGSVGGGRHSWLLDSLVWAKDQPDPGPKLVAFIANGERARDVFEAREKADA